MGPGRSNISLANEIPGSQSYVARKYDSGGDGDPLFRSSAGW
jgi:hypothetical protein